MNLPVLTDSEVELDYLHKQYPWFSREEVLEVLQRFDYRIDRAIAYLNIQSGNWTVLDSTEY